MAIISLLSFLFAVFFQMMLMFNSTPCRYKHQRCFVPRIQKSWRDCKHKNTWNGEREICSCEIQKVGVVIFKGALFLSLQVIKQLYSRSWCVLVRLQGLQVLMPEELIKSSY